MGEVIRSQHRGKAVGCVQSGFGVGWLAATLLSTLAFIVLPKPFAWRALMWSGLLPAVLILFIRRNLEDPKTFQALKAEKGSSLPKNPFAIFGLQLLPRTLLASCIAFGLISVGTAAAIWLPSFLARQKFGVGAIGLEMTVVTVGSFFGFVACAYLSDLLGRRPTIVLFVTAGMITVAAYMLMPLTWLPRLLLGFPLGIFSAGSYSVLGPFFTELFPTPVRASGQSFAYNFGKLGGAGSVALVGFFADRQLGIGRAVVMVALFCYAIAIVATILLPETRGKQLDDGGLGPS